jgi:hypothetical protein
LSEDEFELAIGKHQVISSSESFTLPFIHEPAPISVLFQSLYQSLLSKEFISHISQNIVGPAVNLAPAFWWKGKTGLEEVPRPDKGFLYVLFRDYLAPLCATQIVQLERRTPSIAFADARAPHISAIAHSYQDIVS